MPSRLPPYALVTLVLLAGAPGPARAEPPVTPLPGGETPPPPQAPPPAEAPAPPPAGPGAAAPGQAGEPAPPEAPDLLVFLATLEAQVAALGRPPPRTPTDHGLYDAWKAILEPRAGRMAGRLRRLSEKPRWVRGPDGRVQHLQPASWDAAVRELAGLYTELDGALQQYRTVRITLTRPTSFGNVGPEPGPPDPTAPDRALERLESSAATLATKAASGQVIWAEEVVQYWNLLRTAEIEVERYARDLERWERLLQQVSDLQARVAYGLSFQRRTLSLHKFALRAVTAALQAAEEDRLRGEAARLLPPGSPAAEQAAQLLEGLRGARNAAEAHGSGSAAQWGSLLRQRWLGPRARLVALLAAAVPASQPPQPPPGAAPPQGGPK